VILRRFLHRRRSSRFARDESGTSSIEFVILFPIFMTIFFAGFETGLLMLRNAMLERSTDLAVRDLRLGTPVPPTFEEFKTQICENTFFIENCMERVQVQLRPVSMTTWGPLEGDARCRDVESEIDPYDQTEYSVGANNELMMVRICVLFRPIFPGVGHGLSLRYDGEGNYAMVATSAFVNEPSR
jgi:Flp pilus assembly protein TadG